MRPELRKLIDEKNCDPELGEEGYLVNLAERLRHVPVMYGTDDYDISRLHRMAAKLREDRELKEKGLVRATEVFGPNITTITEFERWKAKGIKMKATHMIVVCDTFDYTDYPVYVMPGQDLEEVQNTYNKKQMQRIRETVDLRFVVDPVTGTIRG
jgi:hypothetical protein